MEWGYGDNGLLVLSQKPPSYPFIRLDVYPVEWLSFNYFHGWLSSDVIDSTDIYYTDTGGPRFSFRDKFIASHTLTLRPLKGLDVSLGESIVYSDKLEILYLIPVTFFRLADHYLSRQSNAAGNNAQFFASISSRGHLKNTHLYGTLFIDEITLNGLFDSQSQRNQIGFTLGASVTDLPINNLTAKLEYSKIYPYAYDHFISTTTYESASYVLGHWMGNNADQVYASLKYRFLRGLEAKLWARFIRQGEKGDTDGQYEQPQPAFLSGLRTNHTYFGASVKYEFLHELFIRARYQLTKTSSQQEDLSFVDKSISEFHFAIILWLIKLFFDSVVLYMNKNYKEKKIYLAGHTGMVGSAIKRGLEANGYKHLLVKDFPGLDLMRQDETEKLFQDEKPEVVIVAAAKVGGILANNTYRAEFIYDNLMIEANIINAAYKNDVEKLIFLGSSCIYPKLAPQPLKEEYLLSGYLEFTNEPYAIAKIAGIKLCENYYRQYGCNFYSVMPTNMYGPFDNFDLQTSHVLPALIRKIYEAKKKK